MQVWAVSDLLTLQMQTVVQSMAYTEPSINICRMNKDDISFETPIMNSFRDEA
jgi:hypothetical protein